MEKYLFLLLIHSKIIYQVTVNFPFPPGQAVFGQEIVRPYTGTPSLKARRHSFATVGILQTFYVFFTNFYD